MGFLSLYHVGVTRGASRFCGSSSGALNAASIACGKSVGKCGDRVGQERWGTSARQPEWRLIPPREGGRGEGCLRASCPARGPALATASLLPLNPYENPEDSGLWSPHFAELGAEAQSREDCSQGQEVGQSV